ncbi:hypothetical protein CO115_01515 [Candidatus Falkowbacteria bacterium CG_4_9_14_3_um_filter_36_9]|uniref:Uncharacterized protein n=1 Tax=Candidatus Falkowbacteria bacterium CG02_land_8_20_14_3_00_36_14 TaxID=1974560 RepID=A0A2M7DMH2_9BACT|nr:MAG: hypothetical protein COS18_03560 [Candidatus Falkowbacteria bacterium CG02_land_8_20_14_3_00_36_14]PIX10781.1 MAG: hypothetical protein COZ73_04755 [Candidatus Falkowbacteria bacterium CG_4_8_14_3_um_filter_36_11]PJA11088.1 MAG: hypothetical protein COX67_01670 [Candidatus Falkowbacteria bacterium CG_4_10_14_0_2_um_filter_36_22]PJB20200.1 MAG: hypothetical protein CO115_01515 [Candidatus Falkowbacteria bacterium CG_4_9_14_3_um_filter_36_9]
MATESDTLKEKKDYFIFYISGGSKPINNVTEEEAKEKARNDNKRDQITELREKGGGPCIDFMKI